MKALKSASGMTRARKGLDSANGDVIDYRHKANQMTGNAEIGREARGLAETPQRGAREDRASAHNCKNFAPPQQDA